MKKTIHVNKGSNAFTVQIGGNPSNTAIFDKVGKLLRTSLVNTPHFLTHRGAPGEYVIETDGEILEVEVEKISLLPIIFGLSPDNLERIYETTEWYDIEDDAKKLSYIKEELIRFYSEFSFQSRKSVIPDYKLQNAALGVYDKKILEAYKSTIQSFREEFYRLKEEIEQAKSLEELKAIEANFPTEITSG